MKAEEARKIAAAANTGNLIEIKKAIKTFAKKGDLYTHVYFIVTPEQKQQLEREGYKVDDVSERNETCIRISWEG